MISCEDGELRSSLSRLKPALRKRAKAKIAIIISFVLGILIGYYYRNGSVEEEIREKLYEQEQQESERRKQENERLWETINGDSDAWEEKWEAYVMEEIINEGHPV